MYGSDWVGFDFLRDGYEAAGKGGSVKGRFYFALRLAVYLSVDDASIPPGHGPIYIGFYFIFKIRLKYSFSCMNNPLSPETFILFP